MRSKRLIRTVRVVAVVLLTALTLPADLIGGRSPAWATPARTTTGRGNRKYRRRGRLATQAFSTFALVLATAVVAPAVADSSPLPPIPVVSVLTTNSGSLSTSVGSSLLLVANITGNNGGYLLGTGGSASVTFIVSNAEYPSGVTLCSDVTTYSLTPGTLTAVCPVSDVDEYPGSQTIHAPSPIQFGANSITMLPTLASADYADFVALPASGTLTVVDPPTPTYTMPTTALQMSAFGPCAPFAYVQGNDGATPYSDYLNSPTTYPGADMWGLQDGDVAPNTATSTTPTDPLGKPWDTAGQACDGETTIDNVLTGSDVGEAKVGCSVNLSQPQCPNDPTNWTDPSTNEALGCPTMSTVASQSYSTTGCVTLPPAQGQAVGQSTSTVVVPSATLSLPIQCKFAYGVTVEETPIPSPAYGPHDGTWYGYQDDPDSAASAPHPDGNNYTDNSLDDHASYNAFYGEGDGLACSAQAQANDGTASQPQWVNIGNPTQVVENQKVGFSLGYPAAGPFTANGNLTVPLPGAASQIRLAYSYYVFQDGSLDGSNYSDTGYTVSGGNEVPNPNPQPIGSNYCSRALRWDSSTGVNGYAFCKNNSQVAEGWTPPIDVDVEPAAQLQLDAVPVNILYQPPTAADSASYATQSTQGSEVAVSMGSQSGISQGQSTSWGLDASVSVGIPDIFKLNVSYSGKWQTGSTSDQVDSSTNTNSVELDTTQGLTMTAATLSALSQKIKPSPRPLPPGSPGAGNTHAPWYNDQFELMLAPQVATFDMNECSDGSAPEMAGQYYNVALHQLVSTPSCSSGGVSAHAAFYPIDTGSLELESVRNLLPCANGSDPADCAISSSPPVTLTQNDARSIIAQDPFAGTALGYDTAPAGQSGQNVDPNAVLGVLGGQPATLVGQLQNATRAGQLAPSQGESKSTLQTWDSSSSYSTAINSVADNSVSVGAELDVPLDEVSVGISASVTWSNETTQGSSMTMNYDKSATESDENDWLASAQLINCVVGQRCWPHNVSVYLDPRFDSLMFQVPPPAVQNAAFTSSGKKVVVTITDGEAGTALDSGELDVYVCPAGSTTKCVVDQDQVVDSLAKKGGTGPDNTVHSSFKAKLIPKGHSYDVYVSSPGGLAESSAPVSF